MRPTFLYLVWKSILPLASTSSFYTLEAGFTYNSWSLAIFGLENEPASTQSFQKDTLWQYRSANMYVLFGAFFFEWLENHWRQNASQFRHWVMKNDSFRKDQTKLKRKFEGIFSLKNIWSYDLFWVFVRHSIIFLPPPKSGPISLVDQMSMSSNWSSNSVQPFRDRLESFGEFFPQFPGTLSLERDSWKSWRFFQEKSRLVDGIIWVVATQRFCYFQSYLGNWSSMTNIFQMGWNHQPDYDLAKIYYALELPPQTPHRM